MKDHNCEIINIDDNFDDAVNRAAELYLDSRIFVYPTDTIYGFGGSPFKKGVVKRLYEIKGRSADQKYILLINDLSLLSEYIELSSEKQLDFLHHIWPNPVSVILRLNSHSAEELGMKTAAFRIPGNRFCKRLLSKIRMPLISTSVNRSGQPPLNDKVLIRYEFGNDIDAIFYSGIAVSNTASTIIDLSASEPLLVREGSVKFNDLMKFY